jgi:hypothetical protein
VKSGTTGLVALLTTYDEKWGKMDIGRQTKRKVLSFQKKAEERTTKVVDGFLVWGDRGDDDHNVTLDDLCKQAAELQELADFESWETWEG